MTETEQKIVTDFGYLLSNMVEFAEERGKMDDETVGMLETVLHSLGLILLANDRIELTGSEEDIEVT